MKQTKKLSELIAPVYYKFFKTKYTHSLIYGGRSSMKGDTAYTKAIIDAASRELTIMIYVPIENTIKDGCFEQAQTVLNRIGVKYDVKLSEKRIIIKGTNSVIKFKGMAMENSNKKPESFKGTTSSSGAGVEYVIFDELASSSDSERKDTIVQTFIRQNPQFIYIFNPPRNRASWLFDFIDEMKRDVLLDDKNHYVLKTTIYDIPDDWEIKKGLVEEAERMKRHNITEWRHAYMGEAVGEEMVAFPNIDDCIISTEELPPINQMEEFFVFTDNGNVDATVFNLLTIHNGIIYILRIYYDSGRLNGYSKSHSTYAKKLYQWLKESGMKEQVDIFNPSAGFIDIPVYTDSLNFAIECTERGLPNAKNVAIKDRALSYELLRELMYQGRVKIYNTDENDILVQQLYNAQIEEKIQKGVEKYMVARPNNNNVPEKRQIHCVDTILYAVYFLYNKLKEQG